MVKMKTLNLTCVYVNAKQIFLASMVSTISGKLKPLPTHLRFVGNRSTRTQNTRLMASEVRASKMQESTRFWVEFCTKYRPTVTTPAKPNEKTGNKYNYDHNLYFLHFIL